MTTFPTNLTALAIDDDDAVLIESLTWGATRSAKTRALLLKHFGDIANGTASGRLRDDIPFRVETRSVRVGRTPYLNLLSSEEASRRPYRARQAGFAGAILADEPT